MMRRFWIINLALFQLSWFCAAFYTEQATYWMIAILLLHFGLSPTKLADAKVLVLLAPALMVDSIHLAIGTFSASATFSSQYIYFPPWLGLLWAMLLVSFNHSLHWLTNKPLWLAYILGAISGTSSYLAGIEAGAMQATWDYPWLITVLALSWAILLPLLVVGYRMLNPLHSASADKYILKHKVAALNPKNRRKKALNKQTINHKVP
ncbi:DUF2878 domain-containing protein [Vibrio sp. S11_S32]|uniref:DUF2878 domain-containing protein n=1 Tax=Vibrio sp. S11_S32 TaxID=2720225 RepID=UPI001680C22E|nr:DUF2878 domain-containing protein [Vibrio sp. S11_S32]MBD1575775.1 DUF2878 domain-containing protein [Vibrio sp. S11_S32]